MAVGKMKLEYREIPINKFAGLKSKGVNIATEFDELRETLFNQKVVRHKMKRIQSKKHKPGTYVIREISLSRFDDKRFVLDDGIHTLSYFRKKFKKIDSQK